MDNVAENIGKKNKSEKEGTSDTKAGRKQPRTSLMEDILLLLVKILVVILIFFLLFTFIFGATRLQEVAMEPNFKNGDLVIFYRLDKDYVADNCVVYKYQGKTQVMRVVAIAGDTVDMSEDGLLINGALQSEPNPLNETLPYENGITFPAKLKTDEVFLLGDSRENSTDSRVFGPVKVKDTLGEVMTIVRRRNF